MHKTIPIIERILPTDSNFFFKGVFNSPWLDSIWAIWPTSVSIPILVTTPNPCPYVTSEEAYAILIRSAKGVEESKITSAFLLTAKDSPVKEDSITRNPEEEIKRISEGIRSPSSKTTISPTITFLDNILVMLLFLNTFV